MTFAKPPRHSSETQHHVFLLLENFTHLAFSCALEPLRTANLATGRPLYSWQMVSADGLPVRSSNGTTTLVDAALAPLHRNDTLVVVGGMRAGLASTSRLLAQLRHNQAHGVRLMGICGGVELLASAGLLQGQDCAVDWQGLRSFAERHPGTRPSDRAFVRGPVPTAASGISATDLMLHEIGARQGADLASLVGDMLSYGNARPTQGRQRVSVRAFLGVRNGVIAGAVKMMQDNVDAPLTVSEIAAALGVSTRQIERLFARYLKDTPTRYYTALRLDHARSLLRDTDLSVTEISLACGFNGSGQFSKVYKKHFGTSPRGFRAVQLEPFAAQPSA
ncbi:GlxA family transcriptional regulator [Cereibacter sphaeroides]|nr:GlxA family transcriptional regulator [Cereibacter sphaeroides]